MDLNTQYAESLLHRQEFEAFAQLIEQANKATIVPRYLLATYHYLHGETKLAEKLFDECKNLEWFYQEMYLHTLINNNKPNKALQLLSTINSTEALIFQAKFLFSQKKYEELKILINTNFTNVVFLNKIHHILYDIFCEQDLTKYIKKIVTSGYSSLDVKLLLGKIYLNIGSRDFFKEILHDLDFRYIDLDKYDTDLLELAILCNENYLYSESNLLLKYVKIKNQTHFFVSIDNQIKLGNKQDAHKLLEQLSLNYNCFDTYIYIGFYYFNCGDLKLSLLNYQKAINIKSDDFRPYYACGEIYNLLGDYKKSFKLFAQAYSLNKSADTVIKYINSKLLIADWTDIDILSTELKNELYNNSVNPFYILSLIDDPEILKQNAIKFSNNIYNRNYTKFSKENKSDKIRIGYFSSDIRDHAVYYLLAGIFKEHDKSEFEVFLFNTFDQDIINSKASDYFDDVIYIGNKNITQAINIVRDFNLDIAINLNGHTTHNRNDLFASRVATVQISHLGFPGTTGISNIDYIIADKNLIPPSCLEAYSENVAYIDIFQQNNSERFTPPIKSLIKDTKKTINIGCFASGYKITPKLFNIWLGILKSNENTNIYLIATCDLQKYNLLELFNKAGVDGSRVFFLNFENDYHRHLSRYINIDLVLDTYPFNGGTTTSDALWMCTPVASIYGRTYASRMTYSLLKTYPDDIYKYLLAGNYDEYVDKITHLIKNPKTLLDLNKRMVQLRDNHLLFNSKKHAMNLEDLYKSLIKK